MENTVLQVPIEDIIPNRFQPRLSFDDDSLKDLAASIKEHGIIQPLVLRRKNDKYEIIAGERRYKAAKMAGLVTVPAIISNMNDNESAEVAIVENVQRKDLTAIEEAKSYQSLLDKGYMTQEELAKRMGLSQSAISNKLRLLTLDESVQDAVLQEKISERHARSLLKLPSHELQKQFLEKVIKERLTVKLLEEAIKKELESQETNVSAEQKEIINPVIEQVSPINTEEELKEFPVTEKDDALENITPEDIIPFNPFKPEEKNPEEIIVTESLQNKFFNELENSAVNMNVDEIMPDFNESASAEEEIEMLDDLFVPTDDNNKNYLAQVKEKIQNLNLDKDKVIIDETESAEEYLITIKIKKD